MGDRLRPGKGKAPVVYALLLLAALAGGAAEGGRRFAEVRVWNGATADLRDGLRYGPYGEVFAEAELRLPPTTAVLLYSDWDPALLPYYLYPRKIYQVDVDPETNQDFMKLPPSPYPRRRPESFAVDWIIGLRDVNGATVPEFREAGGP